MQLTLRPENVTAFINAREAKGLLRKRKPLRIRSIISTQFVDTETNSGIVNNFADLRPSEGQASQKGGQKTIIKEPKFTGKYTTFISVTSHLKKFSVRLAKKSELKKICRHINDNFQDGRLFHLFMRRGEKVYYAEITAATKKKKKSDNVVEHDMTVQVSKEPVDDTQLIKLGVMLLFIEV